MPDDLRFVIRGAALGAVFGALGGWLYIRFARPGRAGKALPPGARRDNLSLDTGQLVRLGWSIVGVVRQIIELS